LGSYRFWIRNKDRQDHSIDEVILKTAESIAPELTRYRQREIDSAQASNEMLQSAVEATSRAKRRNHIDNPQGYLTRVYKRLVDKFLDREQKLIPVDDLFLEDLVNAGHSTSFEDAIHNRLLLERLLNAMDGETRKICMWRLEGYSESEIATLLNMTSNAVSVRYTRGLKKAVMLLQIQMKDKRRKA